MSIKILTRSGEEVTAIDDARAFNFDAGNKSGIVKGALNEGRLFAVASNVIAIDSCELRISGHRIIIDTAESITMANRPNTATRYSIIAEVVVSDISIPSFRLFIQPANVELIQQNLYKTLNGKGTYQLKIGNFTLGTDGNISDIVRVVDIISGGGSGAVSDIEFNVTTKVIASGLKPEVNVDYNEDTKKYDMEFALPEGSGTNVTVGGVIQKTFNADSKVDKVEGKGLSTNDYTNEDKNKLSGLSNFVIDSSLSNSSTNAVQNKVITNILSTINSDLLNTTNKANNNESTLNAGMQQLLELQTNKAERDASNLTPDNVSSFREKLDLNYKVLWENPSPTSSFSAQTVALSSSDYNYLFFETALGAEADANIWVDIAPKGQSIRLFYLNGQSKRVGHRNVNRLSDTSYSFEDAYWDGSKSNYDLIPRRILGVKL